MRIEKRDVTLNEKDTLLDMLVFEKSLAAEYRRFAEQAERKEERVALYAAADGLENTLGQLKAFLRKPPKM